MTYKFIKKTSIYTSRTALTNLYLPYVQFKTLTFIFAHMRHFRCSSTRKQEYFIYFYVAVFSEQQLRIILYIFVDGCLCTHTTVGMDPWKDRQKTNIRRKEEDTFLTNDDRENHVYTLVYDDIQYSVYSILYACVSCIKLLFHTLYIIYSYAPPFVSISGPILISLAYRMYIFIQTVFHVVIVIIIYNISRSSFENKITFR